MNRSLGRFAYPATVLTLLAGIIIVAGFLAAVALPDVIRTGSISSPAAGPSASGTVSSASADPQPTSAMARSPIGIALPPGADCGACHTITTDAVGVKPIPYLAHPLKGFGNCTACHNPAGLVKTAPGHSGIHANECLICHQENPKLASMSPAPMRPEHMSGQACTTCHGVDKHAPLPSDMAGRGDNCWICHNGPEFAYLFSSASPGTSAAPAAPAAPSPSPSAQPPTSYGLNPPSPPAP